nr:14610_t:CDS:1 [Entrophospora candida]
MWELETVDQGRHILRIGENAASINSLLKLILVLTSLFEAIILPVLLSLVWISIYKIKQRMNSNDFKLCMVATHGYVLRLFMDFFLRYKRLSKGMIVFTIVLFLTTMLGKNIPNIMLSGIIELHNFTSIVPSNIILFNNDSNCIYKSCTSDLTGENFALVANSTTIQNIMYSDYVQNTYWGLNNTLYAVRSKIDAGSCSLSIGDGVGVISSNNLGNETDTPTNTGKYTSSYSGHTPTIKSVGLISYILNTFLRVSLSDRCDISMNLFYISPDFSPDVVKMAKWLYDSGYTHDQRLDRYCTILMECNVTMEWKQMQIFGNTPDDLKISDVQSNNTIEKLEELISTNVQDTDINGKWFGESLIDSVVDKLTSMLTTWRNDIKYKRSESSYNFFDQFGDTISQSLASSIQSMISTVSVDVDKKEIFTAPGLWIELTALIFAILLTCLISMTVLTARNSKMSLPLSVLDFEIISNAIFKEYNDDGSYNQKISWPFNVVYLQDKSYRLISTNESADD